MGYIRKVDQALARRFSLYVFYESLSHVYKIHVKGWTHNDLVGKLLIHTVKTVLTVLLNQQL